MHLLISIIPSQTCPRMQVLGAGQRPDRFPGRKAAWALQCFCCLDRDRPSCKRVCSKLVQEVRIGAFFLTSCTGGMFSENSGLNKLKLILHTCCRLPSHVKPKPSLRLKSAPAAFRPDGPYALHKFTRCCQMLSPACHVLRNGSSCAVHCALGSRSKPVDTIVPCRASLLGVMATVPCCITHPRALSRNPRARQSHF